MKVVSIILVLCAVTVHCQVPSRRGPPRPPPSDGNRSPVLISSPDLPPRRVGGVSMSVSAPVVMPTVVEAVDSVAPVTLESVPSAPAPSAALPPRPTGCSPGCGPTEICAELGEQYCSPKQQTCYVCITMSSIRFPASAISNMFSQQTAAAPAVVPAAPVATPDQTAGFQYVAQPPATVPNANTFNMFGMEQPAAPVVQPVVPQVPQIPQVPQVPAQDTSFGYYPPQSSSYDLFGFNSGFSSGNNNNFLPFMFFDPFGFGFGF